MAHGREDWRRALALYRARSAFRKQKPSANEMAREFVSMDDDALRVAHILPDHSAAAREAIAAELTGRGANVHPAPEPVVPSFFARRNVPRAEQVIFGHGARAAWLCALLGLACFAL